jgi:hypothetical protein
MGVCTSLTHISLPQNLTTFGSRFMKGCYSLINLDLSNLTSLTTIGPSFMYECTSLKSISLPPNLTTLDDYFMNKCNSLIRIDLSNLTSLTSLGDNFMDDCNVIIIINDSNKQIFEKYKKNQRLQFRKSIMHLIKKKS